MKKLLAAILFSLLSCASAQAQCNGVFQSGNVCANSTASPSIGASISLSTLFDRIYGSTPGQVIFRGGSNWTASTTLPATVQQNITSLGTVTTGTWNATPIGQIYGGFGSNISAQSGVPFLTVGVFSFVGTTGTGTFVRTNGPTITNGALNGTLGATTPSSVNATTGAFSDNVTITKNSAATVSESIRNNAGSTQSFLDSSGTSLFNYSVLGTTQWATGTIGDGNYYISRQSGTGSVIVPQAFIAQSTATFSALAGSGTGCVAIDNSGNLTGVSACSGGGIPSGGVAQDQIYYTAASTANVFKAAEANPIPAGADPTGSTSSTAALVSSYGYSKRIVLPPAPGGPTGTYKFNTNLTIPNGIELIVPCGVVIAPSSGITVTNNGVTKAGQCTIVGGAGTVYLGRDVRPEWWGCSHNGSTDDTPCVNAADVSVTTATTNGADGFENTIRLACSLFYYTKSAIIFHPTQSNNLNVIGCGPLASGFTVSASGTFARGAVTIAGQTGGQNITSFTFKNFSIVTETTNTPAGVQCLTMGTAGHQIQGTQSSNLIENVYINGCLIGLGWYNSRLIKLSNVGIWLPNSSSAIGILVDTNESGDFSGDSEISGGQIVCPGTSSGVGTGIRWRSEASGTNMAGWSIHDVAFYKCANAHNGTTANGGTLGDFWFYGRNQADGPFGTIGLWTSANSVVKSIVNIQYDGMYYTAGNAPVFKFAGVVDGEISDISIRNSRVRGNTSASTNWFIDAEHVDLLNISNNQIASFNGTSGPNELIQLSNAHHTTITGNNCTPDGISNAISNLVSSVGNSDYTAVTGNMMVQCTNASFNNANGSTHSVALGNLP